MKARKFVVFKKDFVTPNGRLFAKGRRLLISNSNPYGGNFFLNKKYAKAFYVSHYFGYGKGLLIPCEYLTYDPYEEKVN